MKRAFSLVELVVALGILSVCFFLILPLMQYALQYGKQVERSNLAALLAHAKLQEVRAWTAERFEDFASYPKAAAPHPDHPEFQVQVTLSNASLPSPNTRFEELYPEGERRLLGNSTLKAEVTVSWQSLGSSQVRLVSFFGAPFRALRETQPLVVSGAVPPLLAKDDRVVFSVRALDASDKEVPDLFYSWKVAPSTGTGTIANTTRDGRAATFKNVARLANGNAFYSGGKCRVQVCARVRGEEVCGFSQDITLASP